MALPHLATARLLLRPRILLDLDDNVAMDLDPAVHRFIFLAGPPEPEAHGEALARRIASGWPEVGGIWVVEWRERPGFLGWCGLFPLEDSGLVELGYRYRRQAWGRGVATEAGRAVLAHGFGMLDLDPIVAVAHPGNGPSRRVLEKLGFSLAGSRHHYGHDLAFYRLRRSEQAGTAAADAATGDPR